jgi:hypothetical protein
MGLLAATNGLGDTISSVVVGTLWAVFPEHGWGFAVAATLQFLGALRIAR